VKIVPTSHQNSPDNLAGFKRIVERTARWLAARDHAVEIVGVAADDDATAVRSGGGK